MNACDDLVAFADGELPDSRAKAFRDHLPECQACRDGLVDAMQVGAQLSTPRGTWLLAWHNHLVLDEPVGSRAPETTASVKEAKKFATRDEARQWAIGLWGDDIFEKNVRVFPISVDQFAAIRAFKSSHGFRWKSLLLWEWDRGDCAPELRQLRNTLGPRWLYRQRLVR